MKKARGAFLILAAIGLCCGFDSCDGPPSADERAHAQQEQLEQQGQSTVGLPSITHFREKKLLKHILELRDQAGIVTYTYLFNEMKGKLCFLYTSEGYGIPYATQFTNPQKVGYARNQTGVIALPQADPNGLFSPPAADGTWNMTKDGVQYVEPREVVLTYKLPAENCW